MSLQTRSKKFPEGAGLEKWPLWHFVEKLCHLLWWKKKKEMRTRAASEPVQTLWQIKKKLHSTPGTLFPHQLLLHHLLHR